MIHVEKGGVEFSKGWRMGGVEFQRVMIDEEDD